MIGAEVLTAIKSLMDWKDILGNPKNNHTKYLGYNNKQS